MLYYIDVRTFEMGDRKDRALKVLEEAAEAYAAYQDRERAWADHEIDEATRELEDEIADVIQAACNMAAGYGISWESMCKAMERVEMRNRERGRYDDGE